MLLSNSHEYKLLLIHFFSDENRKEHIHQINRLCSSNITTSSLQYSICKLVELGQSAQMQKRQETCTSLCRKLQGPEIDTESYSKTLFFAICENLRDQQLLVRKACIDACRYLNTAPLFHPGFRPFFICYQGDFSIRTDFLLCQLLTSFLFAFVTGTPVTCMSSHKVALIKTI